MRVLIVSYNWPPRNAIGTHRPYSWAKHWSERGVSMDVLTAKKKFFDGPQDLCLSSLSSVRVTESPYLELPFLPIVRDDADNSSEVASNRTTRLLRKSKQAL